MTTALDAAYQALPADLARRCRLLAQWPGPDLTVPAAAAALDLSPDQAATTLESLAAARLLNEDGQGRYRFPAPARDHAQARSSEQDSDRDRGDAAARVISYYLRASAAADLLVLPGRLRLAPAFFLPMLQPPASGDARAALEWGDCEIENLIAAQQAAYDLGLYPLAWQFADTCSGWLSHRQDYPAWDTIARRSLSAAGACADLRATAMSHLRLACLHRTRGQNGDAWLDTNAARTAATISGDYPGQASAHQQAGLLLLAENHPGRAIAESGHALACWRLAGGHQRGEAIIARQLGRAYAARGHFGQAAGHFQAALDTFTGLGETYHRGCTLLAMAQARLAAADPAAAIGLLDQALPLMDDPGHALGRAQVHTTAAQAHLAAREHTFARSHLGDALRVLAAADIPPSDPVHARAHDLAVSLGLLRAESPAGPVPARPEGQES